jgi:demethylmenaquinone methyltransferase/2-methoxy-6-polyprenyl-1,4-benzoquinol methylase
MNAGLQALFSRIAPRYDWINHVLTLGLDESWRRAAARSAARLGGRDWLDVACGPGEMARRLAAVSPAGRRIVATDFTAAMVAAFPRRNVRVPIRFVLSEAGHLPFAASSFDLVTLSFATRNLNTSRRLLLSRFREFRRVIRPGGAFLNLESSQPASDVIRTVFHAFVRLWVGPVGRTLSGSRPAYDYLAATIPRFYEPDGLAGLILEAGFKSVTVSRLCLGAAAIHLARK